MGVQMPNKLGILTPGVLQCFQLGNYSMLYHLHSASDHYEQILGEIYP